MDVSFVDDGVRFKNNQVSLPLKLDSVFPIKYRIRNLTEDKIFECLAVITDEVGIYHIAGELKTKIEIMPKDEVVLQYLVLPLHVGFQDLPQFHLIDSSVNSQISKIDIKKLNDSKYIASMVDKHKQFEVQYIIKAFTQKVLIEM